MRWRTRNTAIRLAIGEPKGSWGERQGGEEADKIGDSLGRRGLGDEPTNQCQSYRPCQDGRAFCRDHRDADHQDCIRTHQQPQIAKQLRLGYRRVG
jgi:hypothetical protein